MGGTADTTGTHLESSEGAIKLNNGVAHAAAIDALREGRARLATGTTVITIGLQVAAATSTEGGAFAALADTCLAGDASGTRVTTCTTVIVISIGVYAAGGAGGQRVGGKLFRLISGGIQIRRDATGALALMAAGSLVTRLATCTTVIIVVGQSHTSAITHGGIRGALAHTLLASAAFTTRISTTRAVLRSAELHALSSTQFEVPLTTALSVVAGLARSTSVTACTAVMSVL